MSPLAITIARAATASAWLLYIFDMVPWGWDVPDNVALFAIAVACVGSFAIICNANARPAHEVYQEGKTQGRRELLLEQRSANVTALPERRLTVVPQFAVRRRV